MYQQPTEIMKILLPIMFPIILDIKSKSPILINMITMLNKEFFPQRLGINGLNHPGIDETKTDMKKSSKEFQVKIPL